MSREKIHYAQCWEDPRLSLAALEIGPEDDVLSIASGGDNSLALLSARPRSLTVIDRNPAQLFLIELKIRAIECLDYDELLGFVGVRPGRDRIRMYESMRPHLSGPARGFWDGNRSLIRSGLLHCGKYERFFSAVRRFVLPLIHSSGTIRAFFSCSTLEEQEDFYRNVWANRRWRTIFRVVFGKTILGRLGRKRSFYRYVTIPDTADFLYRRITRSMSEWPIRENPLLAYSLAGNYLWPEGYPFWLQRRNFATLKESADRVRLKFGSLESILDSSEPGTYSKFNLSNIFEYMSEEDFEATLGGLIRVSPAGGRIAFWTLFIPRPIPETLNGRLRPVSPTGKTWVFYEDFQAWRIS